MSTPALPLIVEPAQLAQHLDDDRILIVDLSKPEVYAQSHIPGAVHLDYAQIVTAQPPVMGLLPSDERLAETLSSIGLTRDHHVVAYDDEGGGRASRLLWTLDVIGHPQASLLNGGLHAWAAERLPLTDRRVTPARSRYAVTHNGQALADRAYVLAHLKDDTVALLDARSRAEYTGQKALAARGGHIPGAVSFDWLDAIDQTRALRLKPAAALQQLLRERGLTPDREIITYCHTHHRSALSYIMLKSLGYDRIKGYPGSWSDWGNSPDTPVER